MNRRLLTERRVLASVLVVLVILSLLPSRVVRPIARPLSNLARTLLSPVTDPLHRLSVYVRRPADLAVDLGTSDDYELAKKRIVELEEKLNEARQQIRELTQVRQQLSLEGVRLLPATVTAWSGRRLAPLLTINRGTRQGVRPGYVVAEGFNLVGEVVDAGLVTSTVRLITAPGKPLNVRFVPQNLGASLATRGGLVVQIEASERGGGTVFGGVVDADAPVQVGDLAHLTDNTWPNEATGFVVGKVVKLEKYPEDPTLRRLVTVQPLVSLPHLRRVVVLIAVTE